MAAALTFKVSSAVDEISFLPAETGKTDWYLDSWASYHAFGNRHLLSLLRPVISGRSVSPAVTMKLNPIGVGTVHLQLHDLTLVSKTSGLFQG